MVIISIKYEDAMYLLVNTEPNFECNKVAFISYTEKQ